MKFVISEKKTLPGLLLVITDKEILGEKFTEGKLQLDLSQNFYQGEEKNEEDTKKMLFRARHLHFTGKEAVAMGLEIDLVNRKNILYVKGIPHAEVVRED